MSKKNRTEINQQNAAHSTGPITTEGKRRASLNALRHGLTGQTVVLPTDDLAAYQESCRQYHATFKPVGLVETDAVQTIADTTWRLHRIRAMENNLFALGFEEQSAAIQTADPLIHCALAQAKSVAANVDVLTKLSLYEQRLNRTLAQAKAELKQLQENREAAQERAFKAAHRIDKLKQAQDQEWDLEEAGFEFSNDDLDAWIARTTLTTQAETYECDRRLPT